MGSDHRSVVAQFVITAPKKETSQNNSFGQDDKTRSGEAIKFEERFAELERKVKYKAKIAATTQKSKMKESLTMSKQAEGVADSGRRHKRCSYGEEDTGKTCCGS